MARRAIGAAAALTALAVCASAGASGPWTLRFGFMPARVYQGAPATVSVHVKPSGALCTLVVNYADGSAQGGLRSVVATKGIATWKWNVAPFAAAGPAHAKIGCGRSDLLTRSFTVVGGSVAHSKLTVVTRGYSQRNDSYGGGSTVSYGVVVHNPSAGADAESVSVLVNFVDANDHVLQTATTRIPTIAADSTFNVGGSASLPATTPVAKLEVVIQTDSFAPHKLHVPAVENVQIVPSSFEPGWVGAIDGAVVNDDQTRILTNAQLSIVLFDSTGNVVGGGTGFVFATLPPGTRSFFNATTGFAPVPIEQASTAAISIEPSYTTP